MTARLSDDEVLALYMVVHHAGLAWTLDDPLLEAAYALVEMRLARDDRDSSTSEQVRFWPTAGGADAWWPVVHARAHALLAAQGDACCICEPA